MTILYSLAQVLAIDESSPISAVASNALAEIERFSQQFLDQEIVAVPAFSLNGWIAVGICLALLLLVLFVQRALATRTVPQPRPGKYVALPHRSFEAANKRDNPLRLRLATSSQISSTVYQRGDQKRDAITLEDRDGEKPKAKYDVVFYFAWTCVVRYEFLSGNWLDNVFIEYEGRAKYYAPKGTSNYEAAKYVAWKWVFFDVSQLAKKVCEEKGWRSWDIMHAVLMDQDTGEQWQF